jgi:predicted  nucleic acid-binding Zn-ribbon protein
MRKITQSEFESRLNSVSPHVSVLEFKGLKATCLFHCHIHDQKYTSKGEVALRASGCPECARQKFSATKGANFLTKHRKHLAEKPYSISFVGPYRGSKVATSYQCDHGATTQVPEYVELNTHCCPQEANRTRGVSNRDEGQSRFFDKVWKSNLEPLGQYVDTWTPILMWCSVHDDNFYVVPNSFHERKGCPRCSRDQRSRSQLKPHSEFEKQLAGISPTIRVTSEYRGAFSKVSLECLSCGGAWNATPDSLLNMQSGCPRCANAKPYSKAELELGDFVESLGFTITRNDRTTIGQELDVYVPDRNIAFEYNGLYYHSDKFVHPMKHRRKWEAATTAGIRLITLWEDDWRDKRGIVETLIKTALGNNSSLMARKLVLDKTECMKGPNMFYEKTHIQGRTNSGLVTYILRQGTEVVAAMTFNRVISNRGTVASAREFELVRFSSSHRVVGGASRLFAAFLYEYDPKSVVSYSMNDYFSGGVYPILGFEIEYEIPPDYWPVYKGRRRHKSGFRKSALAKLLPSYDSELTEKQNCHAAGIYRVWDTGKIKWRWNKNTP